MARFFKSKVPVGPEANLKRLVMSEACRTKSNLVRRVARSFGADHVEVWEIINAFLSELAREIHDRRSVSLPYFGRFNALPDGSVAFSPSSMCVSLTREQLAEEIRNDALARSRLPADQPPAEAIELPQCQAAD